MYKVLKNFLSDKEIREIPKTRTFLSYSWFSLPLPYAYQTSILEEASSFVDLSSTVGVEEWFHNPFLDKLPEEHYDKDEALYASTGELSFPLCSCIFYMKIDNLVGAQLELLDEKVSIKPESNMLVILKPGVYHKVSEYISGVRTSVYLNPWDKNLCH